MSAFSKFEEYQVGFVSVDPLRRNALTIGQNLGLNDGHDPLRLADGGVAGQHGGVLLDGLEGGGVLADLQHRAPLGKVAAVLLVLSAAGSQVIKTYGQTLQQHYFHKQK